MIELSLLKKLENDGLGTIDVDLFWQEAPLDNKGNPKEGVWIVSTAPEVSRFSTDVQLFDIYSRYSNKLVGAQKLKAILDKLKDYYGDVCDLPAVPPYVMSGYERVMIEPISGIASVGSDEQDKMVYVISGTVRYNT